MFSSRQFFLGVIIALLFLQAGTLVAADKLVVYSARNEHLIKPIFDAYTVETGTEIEFITDKEGPLLQRLKAEGENTLADLLITVDAGNLWHAAEEGVLRQIQSDILAANVPAHLRDPDNRWFGLSRRARTIVYSTERIDPAQLSSYEALGDPAWQGRLLLRTSKKVYNQSLVAMLVAEFGETRTEEIVRSWVANLAAPPFSNDTQLMEAKPNVGKSTFLNTLLANLAAPPFSNDTQLMEAILAGQGDVGIVNTYYFGRLLKKNPDLKLALYWPNQDSIGVHVNVSGAGVTRHAKHPEAAVKFLEWLSSEKAQNLFADVNMEYPVNPAVPAHPYVEAWGAFEASKQSLVDAGRLQGQAIRLMDRAGYR